uniref:Uncharacterized protein n=1 Tax=Anguilla anguilla TaxID=7936 RepID=A0A0E9SZE0_ANGAN
MIPSQDLFIFLWECIRCGWL